MTVGDEEYNRGEMINTSPYLDDQLCSLCHLEEETIISIGWPMRQVLPSHCHCHCHCYCHCHCRLTVIVMAMVMSMSIYADADADADAVTVTVTVTTTA
jgi:hypothetical protein